tara:strand:+ start:49 stop:495 length:447 start_codon:yes stop_codon:yes gene_type:complete
MVLIIASIFNPLSALLIILTSSTLASIASYITGKLFGDEIFKVTQSKNLEKIREKLKGKGLLPIIILRTVPIAPFSLINLACGSINYSLPNFILGTFIGLIPGITLLVFFQKSFLSIIKDPSLLNILSLILIAVTSLGLIYFIKKRAA